MNFNPSAICTHDAFLENLAVELTDAAYRVALRHGVGEKWLDLQLELWEVLTQAIAERSSSHQMNLA